MSSSYRWRERLLCSLQGQLKLATYLVVFAGFTGASSVGLYLGQRNMFANERNLARASVEECEHAIQTLIGDRTNLEKELLFHSGVKNQLWVEYPNGEIYFPNVHGAPSVESLTSAMRSNPQRTIGLQNLTAFNKKTYLTELVKTFPDGHNLWMISEVGDNIKALNNYLILMIITWGSCLAATLLTISWLVQRIIRPLNLLNLSTAQLNAENLSNTQIHLNQAPTEVEELKDSFNALLERLGQSWAQQKQFVSAVSHELRTPMMIIQGYLQRTIKRNKNLSEKEIEGLQIASNETIRMRRLLDDLLDLSRSDSGRLSISQEQVSLTKLLERVVTLAQNTIPRTIQLTLPKNQHLSAHADPARLQQVLLDLIENAHKYSPEDTPIKVVLREDSQGPAIDVIDQGIGIPAEELEAVFERFKRASNAPYKTGSGLGLSLVKLFTEGMNGRIGVDSQLGQGSCFTVHLKS